MQDTFIDAYTNLAKFENRSSLKTWMIKIMLNNCFKKQQKFSFKNETTKEIDDKSLPMFSTQHIPILTKLYEPRTEFCDRKCLKTNTHRL